MAVTPGMCRSSNGCNATPRPASSPLGRWPLKSARSWRIRIRQVLTIDSDLDIYRDKAGKPLTNLLR